LKIVSIGNTTTERFDVTKATALSLLGYRHGVETTYGNYVSCIDKVCANKEYKWDFYVNGKKDRAAFDGKLEFDAKLIPYTGSDSWVEQTISDIYDCLNQSALPASGPECEFCKYRLAAKKIE